MSALEQLDINVFPIRSPGKPRKSVRFSQEVLKMEKQKRERAKALKSGETKSLPQPLRDPGSASTWGEREMRAFKLDLDSNMYSGHDLIGLQWFEEHPTNEFNSINRRLRDELTAPSKDDIQPQSPCLSGVWGTFFADIVDATANVSRELMTHQQEFTRLNKEAIFINKMNEETNQQIPSHTSTISQDADSAGTDLIYCGVEEATKAMATTMIRICINHLWNGSITPSFASNGRDRYNTETNTDSGYTRVTAVTDGSLRFSLSFDDSSKTPSAAAPKSMKWVWWPRQISVLGLNAKQFWKNKTADTLHDSYSVGQISAEMLSMICHDRFIGLGPQEAYIISANHCSLRLYHGEFSDYYLITLVRSGNPAVGVNIRRTREYNMLLPSDRGEFWDMLVALFRKIEAGEVKTGYAWKDFPGNPLKEIRIQADAALIRKGWEEPSTPPPELYANADESSDDEEELSDAYPPAPAPKSVNTSNVVAGEKRKYSSDRESENEGEDVEKRHDSKKRHLEGDGYDFNILGY